MNIVLYKGRFNYGVVNYFVDELGQALINKGCNVKIIDLLNDRVTIDNNTNLILAYNAIGLNGLEESYNKLGIIFGGLLVDHPFYHYDRIKDIKTKNTFFSLLDEGTLSTAEKYINSETVFTHLMHAGSFAKQRNANKIYDVVVMGGLSDALGNIDKALDKLPYGVFKDIAKNLYKKASADYCKTLDDHLEEILYTMKLSDEILNLKEFNIIISYIYTSVDKSLRLKTRYNAVLNLLKNNINVHYFGTCESKKFNQYNNFINHGPIDYTDALEIMAQSKILLHDIAYFKNGSHERIFSAMLNKTLVISNRNNYSFNLYNDSESIVYYDVNKKGDLTEKVKYYLNNKEEYDKVINNAYNLTLKYNTWENRADEVIEIYNAMKSLN